MTAQIIQLKANSTEVASKSDNEVQYHHYSYAGNVLRKIENVSHQQNTRGKEDGRWEKLGEKHMKCSACDDLDEKLQDFVDGEVDEISRQRLILHLNVCEEFRSKMEQYQTIKMAASSLKDDLPYNSAVGSRLRSRLNQELGLKLKHN